MKDSNREIKIVLAVILVIAVMLAVVYIRIQTMAPEKGRIADEETNARIVIDYPKNEDVRLKLIDNMDISKAIILIANAEDLGLTDKEKEYLINTTKNIWFIILFSEAT